MNKFYNSLKLVIIVLSFSSIANAQTYCAPTFVNGCSGWKNTAITLSTLNWTAPTACTTWDFTTTQIPMAAGTPTAMTVTNGAYCGCAVWVDLNNDGDLIDAGENLFSLYTANANNVYSFNITLPASTPNGLYRMRVIGPWGSDGINSTNGSGPCGAYQYGNYQDFTLNVGGVTPCAVPTGYAASAITSNSATISWSAVSGAVGYEYLVNTTSATPSGAGTATTSTSTSTIGLLPATWYYVHLRTNCGSSNYSAWTLDSFMTLGNCTAPTGLGASAVTSSSANLSWGAVSGAIGYEYAVNTSATPPTTAGTYTTMTTYGASGLTAVTVYYLHVRAVCGTNNNSTWVTYPFTTLPACPGPSNFQVTNLTGSAADISWTAGAGNISYEYVLDNSTMQPSGPGTALTPPGYSASSLTANTLYYMHVRSVCGTNNFSAWDTVSFTTGFVQGIKELNNTKLVVSPNPTSDFVTIYTNLKNEKSKIQVLSLEGKVLSTYNSVDGGYLINLSSFPTGIYFAKYTGEQRQGVVKIIKQE